ncbi:hypothetical protein V1505DRAFT_107859 [Lipomyces doorenjongii]
MPLVQIKMQLLSPVVCRTYLRSMVEDFAIDKTYKFPGWHVRERIAANVEQLMHARSLLIIAYIGHAIVDTESNRLQLILENGTQKMFFSAIHEFCLTSTDDFMQNLDVLAILDCCYAGSAVRAGRGRSVQLLAAGDGRSTVRSRKWRDIHSTLSTSGVRTS